MKRGGEKSAWLAQGSAYSLKECKVFSNSVNFLNGRKVPGNTCEASEGGLARNQPQPQLPVVLKL